MPIKSCICRNSFVYENIFDFKIGLHHKKRVDGVKPPSTVTTQRTRARAGRAPNVGSNKTYQLEHFIGLSPSCRRLSWFIIQVGRDSSTFCTVDSKCSNLLYIFNTRRTFYCWKWASFHYIIFICFSFVSLKPPMASFNWDYVMLREIGPNT